MEWHIVHKTDSLAQAEIMSGNLKNHGIPAVVVPKRSSSYTFAAAGYYELQVPLNQAAQALDILYAHPQVPPTQ